MTEYPGGPPFEGDASQVRRALLSLDPARRDPGYWRWFHGTVMARAAGELARRRTLADLTVVEVVTGWGRTVVPTALLAAAVAAFVIFSTEATPLGVPLGIEELLADGLDGASIPAVLESEAPPSSEDVFFASETF